MSLCDHIPKTSKFFFYFDLETGCASLALYYLYEATFFSSFFLWDLSTLDFSDPANLEHRNIAIISSLAAGFHFLLALLLSMAVNRSSARLVTVYLYIKGFTMIFNLMNIAGIVSVKFSWALLLSVILLGSFIINLYLWFCTQSLRVLYLRQKSK